MSPSAFDNADVLPGAGGAGRSQDDTWLLPPPPSILQIEVGLLQNFCAILSCPDTREAAIVDPAWEVDRLLREIEQRGLRVTKVLITHGHHDHVEGLAEVTRLTGAAIVVNPRERPRVEAALGPCQASWEAIADGQDIAIGRCGVRALETGGHTAGGNCYLAAGYVVTGDVLFVGGCGRTDFPGGDVSRMWSSLQRLAHLPEETRVYPGHNYGSTETSTIGRELLENPFLRCQTFDEFRRLRDPGGLIKK
jgi:hydroxyacylglutathione hydrolase